MHTRRAAALSCLMLSAGVSLLLADEAEPVLDVGPGITPPSVVRQVNPVYKETEGFRISGTVVVGLVVSSKGEPKEVHVVRSLEKSVDQSAVEAVEQWEFEPARKDGRPVAVRITVEIRFHSM